MRRISLICFVAGVLFCAFSCIAPILSVGEWAGGIVGGADSPSFLKNFSDYGGGILFFLLPFGVALLASSVFCLVFPKTAEENCSSPTSLTALGISVAGGIGGADCSSVCCATPSMNRQGTQTGSLHLY